jgi:hypothetical protein
MIKPVQINIESTNNKFVVGSVWTDQSNPPNVRKLIEGKLFTETMLDNNKYVVGRSDKTRLEIHCTSESKQVSAAKRTCNFFIRVQLHDNFSGIVKVCELVHSCDYHEYGVKSRERNPSITTIIAGKETLLNAMGSHTLNPIDADAAIDTIRANQPMARIGKRTVQRLMEKSKRCRFEDFLEDLMKLDDFVEKLQSEDVEGDYHVRKSRLSYAVPELEQDQVDQVRMFKALTVITSAAKKFWTNSRKHIVADGTHAYGVGYGVYLIASCKDALNQNVILGYCLCDAENNENWMWFADALFRHFPGCRLFISGNQSSVYIR